MSSLPTAAFIASPLTLLIAVLFGLLIRKHRQYKKLNLQYIGVSESEKTKERESLELFTEKEQLSVELQTVKSEYQMFAEHARPRMLPFHQGNTVTFRHGKRNMNGVVFDYVEPNFPYTPPNHIDGESVSFKPSIETPRKLPSVVICFRNKGRLHLTRPPRS